MIIPELLVEYLHIMGAKRTMLINCIDDTQTLVVGSSHGDFGFDPTYYPNSFNLCCRSQDLKHSFYLYEKITATCKNLHNLVIFYSTFSPASTLEKSPSEKYICPAINEIFQLNINYKDEELASLCSFIKGRFDNLAVNLPGTKGFIPTISKGFFPDSYGVKRRVTEHLRFSEGYEGDYYLLKMIWLANKLKHNVFIVLSPARSDYKLESISQNNHLFENVKDLSKCYFMESPPILLDLFNDDHFTNEEFGDFDHLDPLGTGVSKLTSKIKDLIELAT